ncbi:hypothetical protein HDU76_011350, partial [Blyttiomyces sp. JEL0837]
YEGVIYNPMNLNQYGDLEVPLLFFTLNWTIFTEIGFGTYSAFMTTDIAGTDYTPLTPPYFYG